MFYNDLHCKFTYKFAIILHINIGKVDFHGYAIVIGYILNNFKLKYKPQYP